MRAGFSLPSSRCGWAASPVNMVPSRHCTCTPLVCIKSDLYLRRAEPIPRRSAESASAGRPGTGGRDPRATQASGGDWGSCRSAAVKREKPSAVPRRTPSSRDIGPIGAAPARQAQRPGPDHSHPPQRTPPAARSVRGDSTRPEERAGLGTRKPALRRKAVPPGSTALRARRKSLLIASGRWWVGRSRGKGPRAQHAGRGVRCGARRGAADEKEPSTARGTGPLPGQPGQARRRARGLGVRRGLALPPLTAPENKERGAGRGRDDRGH
jgi:hypothetical protein